MSGGESVDHPNADGLLPPLPLTDYWLAWYTAGLDTCVVDVDPDGTHHRSGPSLNSILEFLAGHDPNDVTRDGTIDSVFGEIECFTINHPLYTVEDLTRALLGEVLRLRDLIDAEYDVLGPVVIEQAGRGDMPGDPIVDYPCQACGQVHQR